MSNAWANEEYTGSGDSGDYLKLKAPGDYKVRILSAPIKGWLGWTPDNKPKRFRLDNYPEDTAQFKNGAVTEFKAMIVWDYSDKKMKVFETDKAGIIKGIIGYAKDEDFGDPTQYDVKLNRVGTTKDDTRYSVKALPPKALDKAIAKAFKELDYNLDALYDGGHPLSSKGRSESFVGDEEEIEI